MFKAKGKTLYAAHVAFDIRLNGFRRYEPMDVANVYIAGANIALAYSVFNSR